MVDVIYLLVNMKLIFMSTRNAFLPICFIYLSIHECDLLICWHKTYLCWNATHSYQHDTIHIDMQLSNVDMMQHTVMSTCYIHMSTLNLLMCWHKTYICRNATFIKIDLQLTYICDICIIIYVKLNILFNAIFLHSI